MENINKLFLILENLKYEDNQTEVGIQRIHQNLDIIRKYIKFDLNEIHQQCLHKINCPILLESEETRNVWDYVCYLYYILLKICDGVNFESTEKEDLISIQHMNYLTKAIIDCSRYGIGMHLHVSMRQHVIFNLNGITVNNTSIHCLMASLNFFEKILKIKILTSGSSIDSVILNVMAGIYSTLIEYSVSQNQSEKYKEFLTFLWENTSKEKYFKNLLILKSIKQLPLPIKNKLHNDLLEKLTHAKGFNILVRNMIQPLSHERNDTQSWERHEVVARIIAHPSHKKEFIDRIIPQIFNFIFTCLQEEDDLFLIGAGIITLRKLINMNDDYKKEVEKRIESYLVKLCDPEDILTGIIVMENNEFKLLLNFLFTIFCSSSLKSLPSEYIIKYLPFFLNLYSQLPNDTVEQGQIKSIIVQCLVNREKSILQLIMKDLFFNNLDGFLKYKILHSRILINFDEKYRSYTIQVSPPELEYSFEISNVLPKILKTSNNNILIYNTFISILNLLNQNLETNEMESKIDLLQSEDELNEFITNKFKTRISVVSCLTDLIAYKQFYSQFHEDPNDILNVVRNFIKTRLNTKEFNDDIDQNLSIVLAIFQEFLEHSKDTTKFKDDLNLFKTFLKNVKNIATKYQIENIIGLIEGGSFNINHVGQSKYNFARSLLNENQSHLKVYGITQMIKLLHEGNEEILANKHAILALALHVLKDEESYTYLNCIRLLVSLVMVLESEVFETLSAEYLNKDEKIEFRLKIGEAILKVTEDLGPLAYKHKGILINCYLNGCKQQENEFRTSSLSNLATLCRLLSYQIHNFFQELLIVIDSILQTDTYLPLRRSAVMVLSQLLFGMNNLIDFQEYLLPLYRYLNYIVEYDKDEVTRVHATNGLKLLNEKCKSFLFPEQKLNKEIKIFGIKDNSKNKGIILEIV